MRILFITFFILLLSIPLFFTYGQSSSDESQTVYIPRGSRLIRIVCIDFKKEEDITIAPEKTLVRAVGGSLTPGFYIMFSGDGRTSTEEGCKFSGPAEGGVIYADLFYVDKNGTIHWFDISDIKFDKNKDKDKVYGKDCDITITRTKKFTGSYVGASFSYNFKVDCLDYQGVYNETYHRTDRFLSTFLDMYSLINEFSGTPVSPVSSVSQSESETLNQQLSSLQDQQRVIEGTAVVDLCGDINIFKAVWATLTGDTKPLICVIVKTAFSVTSVILDVISQIIKNIVKYIIYGLVQFQMVFNRVLASVLTLVANLNPFDRNIGVIVWRTLRDLAYIVLVFSSLYAGFVWLFEGKGSAFSLIFNIILVALIINFSYAFVKLVFEIAFTIEDGLSGGTKAQLGNFILASLQQANYLGSWQRALDEYKIVKKEYIWINTSLINSVFDSDEKINKYFLEPMVNKITENIFSILGIIAIALMPLMIAMSITAALAMFIVLFFRRFIAIINLLITSPLAILSLAYPNKGPLGKYLPSFPFSFDNWLSDIIKWAVVIPVFLFFVLLGIIFQQNFVDLSKNPNVGIGEFLFVYIFLNVWFLISLNIASQISGVSTKLAERLKWFPSLAFKKLAGFFLKRFGIPGRVGGVVEGGGSFIEKRLGNAPLIGWYLRDLGKKIQNLGKKIKEQDIMAQKKDLVMEDLKNLWRDFVRNPNQENLNRFIRNFSSISRNPIFKEEIEKFVESLGVSDLGNILSHDPNNNFLKINGVGKKIDERFNKLSTALTNYDNPQGQDAFVEFLRNSSNYEIREFFAQLLPNRWEIINSLLTNTQSRIINTYIAPKLVSAALDLYTSNVDNSQNLVNWIAARQDDFRRIFAGDRERLAKLTLLTRYAAQQQQQ